jgi:hypothetical protein
MEAGHCGLLGCLVIQLEQREGQERNAGDPDYRGWLSDTLEGG